MIVLNLRSGRLDLLTHHEAAWVLQAAMLVLFRVIDQPAICIWDQSDPQIEISNETL